VTPVAFAMRGVVPVAYAVFALVLGVAVGLVLRRTVAAMAVTLVVFTFVQIAVPLWVRPHLVPPARQTVTIGDNLVGVRLPDAGGPAQLQASTGEPTDWILAERTVDASGRAVPVPSWLTDCLPRPGPPEPAEAGSGKAGLQACLDRLDALGYRQEVLYQPASRFWTLQWVETALFGGVAGLLAWFCFWWTRRRLA
jgi:hypothetical protein